MQLPNGQIDVRVCPLCRRAGDHCACSAPYPGHSWDPGRLNPRSWPTNFKNFKTWVKFRSEAMTGNESVALWGECGEFAMSARTWLNILSLARWYGWKPTGTKPPKAWVIADGCTNWKGQPADWDGRYFPPDLQRITEHDANALAAALMRPLADIPEHDALAARALAAIPADSNDYWGRAVRADEVVNPFEEFSGPNKVMLRDFITHSLACFIHDRALGFNRSGPAGM